MSEPILRPILELESYQLTVPYGSYFKVNIRIKPYVEGEFCAIFRLIENAPFVFMKDNKPSKEISEVFTLKEGEVHYNFCNREMELLILHYENPPNNIVFLRGYAKNQQGIESLPIHITINTYYEPVNP